MSRRLPDTERVTSAPWYRHPWPWLLMAGPFIVVVAGVITVYLAVVSNDGLVRDDYYKEGLAVNQTSARDRKARELELNAQLMRGDDGRQIRILLRAKPGTVLPAEIRLGLAHPTRPGVDQDLVLAADAGQAPTYSGELAAPLAGRWLVTLEDDTKAWRLTGEWIVDRTVDRDAVLTLPTR